MKKLTLIALLFIGVVTANAQNPVGFDANCKKHISGSVPLAYPAQLYSVINNTNTVILDAREKNEFDVSHIYKAKFVGFDNFKSSSVNTISKSDTIYVYCSIGYRSEKIGEKLRNMGYKNVFNLYGGIFNWANSGYKVFNKENNPTREVHGYNKEWSKMLNDKKCSIQLNK